ncbi:MAG: ATP-binding cassette domain-containing protein [Muribaculaceae bacterium]|nr:ATP-binding cassette domain-containing protein [Muribaculaceae bacterium]
MKTDDAILRVKDVEKQFANVRALNGVSLDVERGSICGLLGPNGAGKTTLLRIVNSIMTADRGEVLLNGNRVSYASAAHIGYMPEERGLYDKMRIEDQIMFFGRLRGGDDRKLRRAMGEYLEMFSLQNDRRRRIKELSKGNQQKVQIIATIVHEPELVILDEPFSGFDPINGAVLKDLITLLHDKGATVVISSHNMSAIEEICRDIALINKGELLVHDSITNIKDSFKEDTLLLTTATPLHTESFISSGLVNAMESQGERGNRKGYAYKIDKKEGVSNYKVLNLASYQSEILHFEEALPSLTDIFLKLTASGRPVKASLEGVDDAGASEFRRQ